MSIKQSIEVLMFPVQQLQKNPELLREVSVRGRGNILNIDAGDRQRTEWLNHAVYDWNNGLCRGGTNESAGSVTLS